MELVILIFFAAIFAGASLLALALFLYWRRKKRSEY